MVDLKNPPKPPSQIPPRLLVAFSGGLDSTVLLKWLQSWRQGPDASADWADVEIEAVHLHHGLQPAADVFEAHCRRICEAWQVPLVVEHAKPDDQACKELGIEAAARTVRWASLMALARSKGAALVLAHHLDDQIETALLQWMRGAGLEGLSAMPALHRMGQDDQAVWVWRPLLGVSKETLRDWAVSVGLRWVEDPSNLSDRHDRNRLRRDVIPVLKEMRAGVLEAMARSVEHVQRAQHLLSEQAEADLLGVVDANGAIELASLQKLSSARRMAILRAWLRKAGLRMPPYRRLEEFDRQLELAGPESRATLEVSDTAFAGGAPFRVCLRAHTLQIERLSQD
jgi:tRNA(Ile)-lysidine synthase